jgi:hypothetical protein
MEYTVKWEIQVEATSPEAAARQALEIQRDENSTATVFEVHQRLTVIDLNNYVKFQGLDYREVPEEVVGSCDGCDVNAARCPRATHCQREAVILKRVSQ